MLDTLQQETIMEAQAARQTHPLLIIAAIAITLFSLVGIGAVLGWIPTSVGTPGAATTPVAQAPEQPAAQPEEVKPAEPKPAVKPRPAVRSEPPHVAARAAVPPPPPVVVAAICRECAVVEDVREVEKAGQASGAAQSAARWSAASSATRWAAAEARTSQPSWAPSAGVLPETRSRKTRKRPWSTRSSSATRTVPRACSPRPRRRAGVPATR